MASAGLFFPVIFLLTSRREVERKEYVAARPPRGVVVSMRADAPRYSYAAIDSTHRSDMPRLSDEVARPPARPFLDLH
jgi:hypothetical protein